MASFLPAYFVLFIILLALCVAVYYGYLSPLARIPCAHRTSALTSLWILWKRHRGSAEELAAVAAAHELYGPVVRLGPREISVRSWDVRFRRILGSRLEKPSWYSAFANYRLVLQRIDFWALTNREKSQELHVEPRCTFTYSPPTLRGSTIPQRHPTRLATSSQNRKHRLGRSVESADLV